jgi:hypothetical protein
LLWPRLDTAPGTRGGTTLFRWAVSQSVVAVVITCMVLVVGVAVAVVVCRRVGVVAVSGNMGGRSSRNMRGGNLFEWQEQESKARAAAGRAAVNTAASPQIIPSHSSPSPPSPS